MFSFTGRWVVWVLCRARRTTSTVRPLLSIAEAHSVLNMPVGYAPEKIQYGINRYVNETRRLYGVMESQLAKSSSGFLVGDRLTVADVAAWGWVASHGKI